MSPPNLARPFEAWCHSRGHDLARVELLPGDVSARRYARVFLTGGDRRIVVDYPPELRAVLERYRKTTSLLAGAGIRVASILDVDEADGWMMLEDLGPESLYARGLRRPWGELAGLFHQAESIRQRIAEIEPDDLGTLNPPLDQPLLAKELRMTWTFFLEPSGLVRDARFARRLEASLEALCGALGQGPTVVCHRDYMARNLMILGEELAVIDHQDLRIGPAAYDLASLCNDSLFVPPALERELLARGSGIPLDDYHRAVAQRTLKALGTFARATAAGSNAYRPLVAPTLSRALDSIRKVPETAAIASELTEACRTMNPF